MSRTIAYRKEMRNKKIKQRKNKIIQLLYCRCHLTNKDEEIIYGGKIGYLNKCHYGLLPSTTKTKAKNGYQTYRHKGEYGKAIRYSRHDKKQILGMNIDEKNYYNKGE